MKAGFTTQPNTPAIILYSAQRCLDHEYCETFKYVEYRAMSVCNFSLAIGAS